MRKYHVNIVGLKAHKHEALALRLAHILQETPASDGGQYVPRIYVCESDDSSQLLALFKEKRLNEDALTISLGAKASHMVSAVSEEMGGAPALFLGVSNPVELGLVRSLAVPAGYMSGVNLQAFSPSHYAQQLVLLQPHVRTLLIPYEPSTPGGAQEALTQHFLQALRDVGFEVIECKTTSSSEALACVKEEIENVQAVLLLEGSSLASRLTPCIAYLCAFYEKFFISSEGQAGIDGGATLAYGCEREVLQEALMQMVDTYCVNYRPLGRQPVVTVTGRRRIFANTFMFPWMPSDLYEKIVTCKDYEVGFEWVNCPLESEEEIEELLVHTLG